MMNSIIKQLKQHRALPISVQTEIAKGDLARSNQWLVGTYIASVPTMAMLYVFHKASTEEPRSQYLFWFGCAVAFLVVIMGPILGMYTRARAIKHLCEIEFPKEEEERNKAPTPDLEHN